MPDTSFLFQVNVLSKLLEESFVWCSQYTANLFLYVFISYLSTVQLISKK
jgi:hypothetical protein